MKIFLILNIEKQELAGQSVGLSGGRTNLPHSRRAGWESHAGESRGGVKGGRTAKQGGGAARNTLFMHRVIRNDTVQLPDEWP